MATLADRDTFGTRLRNRRETLGVSQAQIGRTIGRTGACVSYWESDKHEPSLVDLAMLSAGLGVTVDYLVVGDRRGVLLLGATG